MLVRTISKLIMVRNNLWTIIKVGRVFHVCILMYFYTFQWHLNPHSSVEWLTLTSKWTTHSMCCLRWHPQDFYHTARTTVWEFNTPSSLRHSASSPVSSLASLWSLSTAEIGTRQQRTIKCWRCTPQLLIIINFTRNDRQVDWISVTKIYIFGVCIHLCNTHGRDLILAYIIADFV